MHVKTRCQRNAGAEEENGVQHINRNHYHRMYREALFDGGGDQVEEGEHPEDGGEHHVVNDGRVAGYGVCDDIAIQR